MTIQPLIEVLTHIYDAQVQLLELAERKKDVIIHDRTDELSKLTAQESKIIKRLADLEPKRLEAVSEYLKGLGLKPDPSITLTEFTKRVVQAKEKSALLALQMQLSDVTKRLKDQNATNQDLIRSSLNYIEFTLDLLSVSEEEEMTYRNPSSAKSGFKSGMFDTRA